MCEHARLYRVCEKFRQAQLSLYCRKSFKNFAYAVKVALSSMHFLTQDKKIRVIKFSPMRAGGEIAIIFIQYMCIYGFFLFFN